MFYFCTELQIFSMHSTRLNYVNFIQVSCAEKKITSTNQTSHMLVGGVDLTSISKIVIDDVCSVGLHINSVTL